MTIQRLTGFELPDGVLTPEREDRYKTPFGAHCPRILPNEPSFRFIDTA